MFLGGHTFTEGTLYSVSSYNTVTHKPTLVRQTALVNTALMQLFKEVLTNISDCQIRISKFNSDENRTFRYTQAPITAVDVIYDPEGGYIGVTNNGTGFEIEKLPKAVSKTDEDMYIPEMLISKEWGGTNHNDGENRVTGGVNGLGLKLISAVSDTFHLDTIGHSFDGTMRKHYTQTIRNKRDVSVGGDGIRFIVERPDVKDISFNTSEYTTIFWKPMYTELFHVKPDVEKTFFKEFESTLFAITTMMSAWFGPTVKTSFNGKYIAVTNSESLMKCISMPIAVDDMIICVDRPVVAGYTWDVCVAIHRPIDKSANTINIGLVNGLIVPAGGHIDKVRSAVTEGSKEAIQKLVDKIEGLRFKTEFMESCISVVVSGTIASPEFTSQIKDTLKLKPRTVVALSEPILRKIQNHLELMVKQYILPSAFMDTLKKRSTSAAAKVTYDKYEKSELSGQGTILFITEGDSASGLIRKGVHELKTDKGSGFRVCGLFSLTGVIPNAIKEITKEPLGDTGYFTYDISEKIKENLVLTQLIAVLNLDINKKYNTPEERKTLRYGNVVCAVDWDLDGVGNILGLVITWFNFFWPELVKSGYVHVLQTPIIRAIPKKSYRKTLKIEEFQSDAEYVKWRTTDTDKKYNIIYYKGLARHEEPMIKNMFKNFNRYRVTYSPIGLDNTTTEFDKLINVFYGLDSDLRKAQLSKTFISYTDNELDFIKSNRIWRGDLHLKYDVLAYQTNNLQRKLPNVIDGLVESRRKVLAGMLLKYDTEKNEGISKVYQACGYIADKMQYHHGDGSLNKVIIFMAQSFLGGRNIPLLRGIGGFGTRNGTKDGLGRDSGQPRYIDVKYNYPISNALFPPKDRNNLIYRIGEDGSRIEPMFFVPVLPYAIMESESIPAHGWKQERYARELDDIVNAVKRLIDKNAKPDMLILDEMTKYGANPDDFPVGANDTKIPSVDMMKMNLSRYKCDSRFIRERLLTKKKVTDKTGKTIDKATDKVSKVADETEVQVTKVSHERQYIVGKYVIVRNGNNIEILIYELPPMVGIQKYTLHINEKLTQICTKMAANSKSKTPDAFEVLNQSADDKVHIIIRGSLSTFVSIIDARVMEVENIYKCMPLIAGAVTNSESVVSWFTDVVQDPNFDFDTYRFIDVIEDLFELYTIIHHELNFLKPSPSDILDLVTADELRNMGYNPSKKRKCTQAIKSGEDEEIESHAQVSVSVGQFSKYEYALLYWFGVRRYFYELRINREVILLQLNIALNSDIIRFIESEKYDKVKEMESDMLIRELAKDDYVPFIRISIGECKYKRANEIVPHCIENGYDWPTRKYKDANNTGNTKDSYKHIFAITTRDRTVGSINDRKALIDKLQDELNMLLSDNVPFKGAQLWKNEIDEVVNQFNLGVKSGWMYDDSLEDYTICGAD
jgi:DNA topoisomerase-2